MTDSVNYNSQSGLDHTTRPNMTGADLSRVLPRQNSSGFSRGTQPIGQGGSAIDGANNRIVIQSNDGSINGIGGIPGSTTNQVGFFQVDRANKIIYTLIQGTELLYNPNDNYVNTVRFGFAPDDGRPGLWIAKPGLSATELLQ